MPGAAALKLPGYISSPNNVGSLCIPDTQASIHTDVLMNNSKEESWKLFYISFLYVNLDKNVTIGM